MNHFTPSHTVRSVEAARPISVFISTALQQRLKRKTDQHALREHREQKMTLTRNSDASGVQQNKKMRDGNISFCGLKTGHYVTDCPKRMDNKQNTNGPMFTEYDMNSPAGQGNLIAKIETVLSITKIFVIPPDGIYGELANTNVHMFFHLASNTGARVSKINRYWNVVVVSAYLFGHVDWTRWTNGLKKWKFVGHGFRHEQTDHSFWTCKKAKGSNIY